jgi:hypothetical protein
MAVIRDSKMRLTARISIVAAACLLPLSVSAAASASIDDVVEETFPEYSISPPSPSTVIVCHGFGCKYRAEVALTIADRTRLARILAAGRASAAAERRAIAAAGAWFDRRIAPAAGTQRHVARAGMSYMFDEGQFDCIDTSRNTTGLLLVLEELKLLRYHDVDVLVARGYLLDGITTPHVTAVLTERKAGQKWAVDAWTRGYGQAPEIMPLERWQTSD